jgi:hypothetical protein
MKTILFRSGVFGLFLGSACAPSAMACHNSADAQNPDHKKHHHKTAAANPAGVNPTQPGAGVGFSANG